MADSLTAYVSALIAWNLRSRDGTYLLCYPFAVI
jgi:hypothetical protein